jgi:hypothetical protein
MTVPTDAELADAWTTATRNAVTALFEEYPDHHFYRITMMVSDETYPPFLMPMSEEHLAQLRAASPTGEYDKWDYSLSPLFPYGRDEHYAEVDRLLELRPDLREIEDDAEWDAEFEARMAAVEESMARLDPPSELFQEWLRDAAEVE